MSYKYYLRENVFDAALGRIRRLYDEFPEVIVNCSGGKDSTTVLNLTLRVAEEKGRLPVNVLFLDQEAEWENVITYIRSVMNDPRVRPYWFQGPFKIFNATSGDQPWLYCWKEGAEWIRPKEPNSIHENMLGTDRFAQMFGAFTRTYWLKTPVASISGVRCEESPLRQAGLTGSPCYKDITWGNAFGKRLGHIVFYPLYDWSYRDVWKAIHDEGWPYCRLYDYQYQFGVPVGQMRVSNVHHETAIHSLAFLQEIEPETWDKITARVSGVNAVSKVKEAYEVPAELPPMFDSWREYRDYLLENLIEDPGIREKFRTQFARQDENMVPVMDERVKRVQIAALLVGDYHGTKWEQFGACNSRFRRHSGVRGGLAPLEVART